MSLSALFHEPGMERLGWVLIHFLWQGAMIGLAVAGLLSLVPERAGRLRYGLLLAGLGACLLVPMATWFSLAPSGVEKSDPISNVVSLPPTGPAHEVASVPKDSLLHRLTAPELPARAAALWFCGLALLAGRFITGSLVLRRIRREGVPVTDASWRKQLERLAEHFGIRTPSFLLSPSVQGPMLVGWFRPALVIPIALFSNLTLAQVEAILAHELAHLRRHDPLVNLCQTVVETLFFYHPAVWWIGRELRREREHGADALAVAATGKRAAYLAALATLEAARAELHPGSHGCVAASGGSLLDRARRIAGISPARHRSWRAGMAVAVLVAMALYSVALLPDLSAQPSQVSPVPQIRIRIALQSLDGTSLSEGSGDDAAASIGSTYAFPALTLPASQKGHLENVEVLTYPTDFAPPQDAKRTSAVIPPFPKAFEKQELGWTVDTDQTMEAKLIHLHLKFTYTSLNGFQESAGEKSGPLYANRLDPETGKSRRVPVATARLRQPVFDQSVTSAFLFAQPGKEYTLRVRYRDRFVIAKVRCDRL